MSPAHSIINDDDPITSIPSRFALTRSKERALKLLWAIATNRGIATAMRASGYTVADQQEGCKLLFSVTGLSSIGADEPANPMASAVEELDAWIGPNFRRAQAALTHKHPKQSAFVFNNLHSARGSDAVLAVKTFLDRCDALDDSPERKSTRKADHAALATLETRGIGESVRKHLRSLVSAIEVPSNVESAVTPEESDQTKTLIALHAWVQDWSETARAVIKNRGALIRLGAAKRRRTPAPPAVVAQPVTPPAPQLPAAPPLPTLPAAPTTSMSGSDAVPPSKRVA